MTRTSTVSSAAIAALLGSVLLLTAGCRNQDAQATPSASNTAVVCPAFVPDGMALIGADPAGPERGMQQLEKSQQASFMGVQAASDRLEATCGKSTGMVPGEPE